MENTCRQCRVESDARGRIGGGPIEPSTVRAGFMVVGVGTLLPVVLEGVVKIEFIRMLFLKAAIRVAVEGGSEVFQTLGASLPASERWATGRDVLGGEKIVDSRRTRLTLLGAGVVSSVP